MLETVATHSRLTSKVAIWPQNVLSTKEDCTVVAKNIIDDGLLYE